MKIFVNTILIFIFSCGILLASDNKIEKARELYYSAVENEDKIDPAIDLFKEIKSNNESFSGTAKTYIGSLTAMKAKNAFWPQTKLKYANQGIDKMEEGIKESPEDIEALFIYGTTCYYLPFFFGKSDEAETQLKKLLGLINDDSPKRYGPELIRNAVEFIMEKIDLSNSEKQKAREILNKLPKDS